MSFVQCTSVKSCHAPTAGLPSKGKGKDKGKEQAGKDECKGIGKAKGTGKDTGTGQEQEPEQGQEQRQENAPYFELPAGKENAPFILLPAGNNIWMGFGPPPRSPTPRSPRTAPTTPRGPPPRSLAPRSPRRSRAPSRSPTFRSARTSLAPSTRRFIISVQSPSYSPAPRSPSTIFVKSPSTSPAPRSRSPNRTAPTQFEWDRVARCCLTRAPSMSHGRCGSNSSAWPGSTP